EPEMLDLRIGEDFIQRVDRRARHVVLLERLEPGLAVLGLENRREQFVQHEIILLAVLLGLEALIVLPLGVAGDFSQAAPELGRRGEVNDEASPADIDEGVDLSGTCPCLAAGSLLGLEEASRVLAKESNRRRQQ